MNSGSTFKQSEISSTITSEIIQGKTAVNRIGNATGVRPQDTFFDFYEILDTPEVIDWISFISNEFLVAKGAVINEQNALFGTPRIKVSVRRLKSKINKNPKTNKVISHKIQGDFYKLDSSLGSEEFTEDIAQVNGFAATHVPAGGNTPRKQGGYIFEILEDDPNIIANALMLYRSEILSKEWVFVILEFMYVNRNNEYLVLNQAVFK